MSGHSKWATIKHKKAAIDAKRGKIFTKIVKEITIAARAGSDPASNPRLRTLLDKAKDVNMPQENITRAIKKGTGELPGVTYESIMYEGYAPGNVALLVEVLTDNRNKAVAELRHFFSRQGGRLVEAGAVSWMFERLGVLRITGATEDQLVELLLEHPIRDIRQQEELCVVTCEPSALDDVKQAVTAGGFQVKEAEVEFVAKTPAEVSEEDGARTIDFLDALEDLDDVQNMYTNLE